MKIISLRQKPDQLERFIAYFASHWHHEAVYRDCMTACLQSDSPLPQWLLLVDEDGAIAGGAGLIANDFNSRQDLWPWLCALFIEERRRGHGYGALLIEQIKDEATRLGFKSLHLCTSHVGYYERYGFVFIGMAHDPFGGVSRIYKADL